jgi:hypothetical protein
MLPARRRSRTAAAGGSGYCVPPPSRLADTEVIGYPDRGVNGRRLAPQCRQTFESQ